MTKYELRDEDLEKLVAGVTPEQINAALDKRTPSPPPVSGKELRNSCLEAGILIPIRAYEGRPFKVAIADIEKQLVEDAAVSPARCLKDTTPEDPHRRLLAWVDAGKKSVHVALLGGKDEADEAIEHYTMPRSQQPEPVAYFKNAEVRPQESFEDRVKRRMAEVYDGAHTPDPIDEVLRRDALNGSVVFAGVNASELSLRFRVRFELNGETFDVEQSVRERALVEASGLPDPVMALVQGLATGIAAAMARYLRAKGLFKEVVPSSSGSKEP